MSASEQRSLASIAEALTLDDPGLAALLTGQHAPPRMGWRRLVWFGAAFVLVVAVALTLVGLGLALTRRPLWIAGCGLAAAIPLLVLGALRERGHR